MTHQVQLFVLMSNRTDDFTTLVSHRGEVSIISSKDFDPQERYKEVISAVKAAGGSEVKVYRLHVDKTRAEYYVVALRSEASMILGYKAKAVES